jgi:hypothetical protein
MIAPATITLTPGFRAGHPLRSTTLYGLEQKFTSSNPEVQVQISALAYIPIIPITFSYLQQHAEGLVEISMSRYAFSLL